MSRPGSHPLDGRASACAPASLRGITSGRQMAALFPTARPQSPSAELWTRRAHVKSHAAALRIIRIMRSALRVTGLAAESTECTSSQAPRPPLSRHNARALCLLSVRSPLSDFTLSLARRSWSVTALAV